MHERGLPIVDGAPACPFVAFEDDRDERATSPDHRHRCYAELSPAPRALAHQEAYCLASAFPVCPTFQDWARREAARARTSSGGAVPPPVAGGEPQRNPPRDWSAPPPWAPGTRGDDDSEDETPGAPGFLVGRSRPEQGLSGSAADRLAAAAGPGAGGTPTPATPRTEEPAPADPGRAGPDAEREAVPLVPEAAYSRPAVDPRPSVPGPPPIPPQVRDGSPAGLEPARRGSPEPPPSPDLDDDWDDEDEWDDPQAAPATRSRDDRGRDDRDRGRGTGFGLGADRRPKVGDTRRRREPDAPPSWERPRRYEAYPTLKTRVGLRLPSLASFPRLGVMALALVVAAIALFFLPALLGLVPSGNDGNTGVGGSPSPSAAVPSASAEPTTPPAPTPQVYVVQEGDTLSSIAQRFNLSLAELIEANREALPNPDILAIGDQLIIPVPPPDEVPGGSANPSLVVP